jgi:hypothetical protein
MVTVTAKSFEHVAVNTPLRFPPPMIALAHRADSFDQQWHYIEYAFDVGDPATLPPIPNAKLVGEEQRVVNRYVAKAKELAASVMLTADDGVRISWDAATGGEPTVKQMTRTPSDIETGFVAIFRQFYLHNEHASYPRVRRILHDHASAATDPSAADRLDELKRWSEAVKRSHQRSLRRSVLLRAIEVGDWRESPESVGTFPDRETPEVLINRYLNIDRLHWDSEKALEAESRPKDKLRDGGLERLDFIDGAVGLAHLYIGVAELARRAFGLDE